MNAIRNLVGKKSIEKEVKKMRKLLAILTIATFVVSTNGIAFAGFQSDGDITKTAIATISGEGDVILGLSVALKDVGTDDVADPGEITWTVSLGQDDWKHANQYLEVGGFETYSHWGIQIYTDNKNGTGNSDYTGAGNPAGLVNTSTGKSTLPMCYRIAVNSSIRDGRFPLPGDGEDDLKMQEKYIATGLSAGDTVILRTLGYTYTEDGVDVDVPSDYVSDGEYFAPWFWMLDKGWDLNPDTPRDPDDSTTMELFGAYTSFVDSGRFQIAPDDYFSIPERAAKYCVYLGAKFTGAAAGTTYTTTKLTVEMYHVTAD